jgi:uncharacterized protein (DUF4213/DUF364 family)
MASVIGETIDLLTRVSDASHQDVRIEDLVLGVFFTGVKLSTGHGGVAFTPIGEVPEAVCCPTTAARMPQAGELGGKPAFEVLAYSLDKNVLKSAMGVATLNALSQPILERKGNTNYRMVKETEGFDLLEIQPQETVSLIGAFGPYIRRLKMMGNRFFIIEKNTQTLRPEEMKYFTPESEMDSALEESHAVVMTGTAIVNHTMDAILSRLSAKQRSAIIGPTASMLPDAFFRRRIRIMAGISILDPDRMIQILKQGGSGYHLLKECSEKIALISGSGG